MQKSCGNAAIPTALLEFLFRFLFFCISDFLDFCQSICVCHVPCERCQCRVSPVDPEYICIRNGIRKHRAGKPEAQMAGRILHFTDRIVIALDAELCNFQILPSDMFLFFRDVEERMPL